jgi:hypothetical protein
MTKPNDKLDAERFRALCRAVNYRKGLTFRGHRNGMHQFVLLIESDKADITLRQAAGIVMQGERAARRARKATS